MKEKIEKRILGLFLVILLLLAWVTLAAFKNIQSSAETGDWINHAFAIQAEADALEAALNAGQAAELNFVVTGNARDRETARLQLAEAAEHLEIGKALTRRVPEKDNEFLLMAPLVTRQIELARAIAQAYTREGFEAARRLAVSQAAEPGLAELHRHVRRLKESQSDFLRASDKQAYEQAQSTRLVVVTGAVLNVIVLLFMGYLIKNDIASRRRAASVLEEANQRLEATVSERTAGLVAANQDLAQKSLEQSWSSQAAEHQLRFTQLVINSVSDVIIVISKAVNISVVNPAVERHTGFESKDLIGGPLERILKCSSSGDNGEVAKTDPIRACLKEGRDLLDWPGVLHIRDGEGTPIHFRMFPLREKNKVVGGVITVRLPKPTGEPRA